MTEEATLRAVVCDDDPVVRGVIGDLLEAVGGEVVAETDAAIETAALIERFTPDVVVLDLALRHGTGTEVLQALTERGDPPHVVVFTAYDALAPDPRPGVDVIHKPDFEGLSRCLASLRERPEERRRPVRLVRGASRPTVDDAATFYRFLNEALPGDVLACITVAPGEAEAIVPLLRHAVRVQDRVHPRSGDVLLLLIGGAEAAVTALQRRLATDLPDIAERTRAVDVGDDPSGAFATLTA